MKGLACILILIVWSSLARAEIAGIKELESFPHSQIYSQEQIENTEYLLGLGALQKIGGRWRHKHSEHLTGNLSRNTWQINEAYTAVEAFEWFSERLPGEAELLFECSGRSCGSSAQWADRVFGERVLYGHDERQLYAAYRLADEEGVARILVLYASDRANRRHFIRLDVLVLASELE